MPRDVLQPLMRGEMIIAFSRYVLLKEPGQRAKLANDAAQFQRPR